MATPLVFLILEMRPVSDYLSQLPLPNPLRRGESHDAEDEGTERHED